MQSSLKSCRITSFSNRKPAKTCVPAEISFRKALSSIPTTAAATCSSKKLGVSLLAKDASGRSAGLASRGVPLCGSQKYQVKSQK
jgi:hypothetical protein